MVSHSIKHMLFSVQVIFYIMWEIIYCKKRSMEDQSEALYESLGGFVLNNIASNSTIFRKMSGDIKLPAN